MALPIEKQAKYWGIGAIILALMLWYLGNILLPFVLGAAIAYFLDPLADRLEAAGFTRISATAIIFIGLLLIILPAVLLAIVVLSNQIQGLLNLTIDAERVASIESSIRSILPVRLAEQFDLVQAPAEVGGIYWRSCCRIFPKLWIAIVWSLNDISRVHRKHRHAVRYCTNCCSLSIARLGQYDCAH